MLRTRPFLLTALFGAAVTLSACASAPRTAPQTAEEKASTTAPAQTAETRKPKADRPERTCHTTGSRLGVC